MISELLTPKHWRDYELIDCGGYEKLERFGPYTLRRPEPQALWDKALPEAEWESADASFTRDAKSEEKGVWNTRRPLPQRWTVEYGLGSATVPATTAPATPITAPAAPTAPDAPTAPSAPNISMQLALTAFKHVGLFPEQAENWDWLHEKLSAASASGRAPKILNLFAYTGGASLAAAAAGAQVTHLDSVKQVVNWASDNARASRLDNIRWITDDAAKFVKREARRGSLYDGIILDPPAYGRGPEGEKWILEQHLPGLLKDCAAILRPDSNLLVLNLYSMGLSALLARQLIAETIGSPAHAQFGELYLKDRSERALPLGVFYRHSTL